MKKIINTALVYAILGLAAGVFYREFTKLHDFTGNSTLATMHTHLLALGVLFFLLLLSLEKQLQVTTHKLYKYFYGFYNVGLGIVVLAFFVRGIMTVQGAAISRGLNASIAGIAGIGHALLGTGIIIFIVLLKKRIKE